MNSHVEFGLERLLAEPPAWPLGRVAYIGTRASRLSDGRRCGLEALRAAGVSVAVLWAPEHGYAADGAAGADVADGAAEGLPLYALYGRRAGPDAAMLEMIDTMVFDLQDVGARYYTYWYVLKRCLHAAAAAGKRLLVCDRPNPLGDRQFGNVLSAGADAPVGCWPMAMQHGLTVGEVAADWADTHGVMSVDVSWMTGWRRRMRWEDIGTPWTAPSPNLPSLASVSPYPGVCLGEGTTLSVGRGTPIPFQWLGAPWLDAEAAAAAVNDADLGWTATPVAARPLVDPFAQETCQGIHLVPARGEADPVAAVLHVLASALRGAKGAFRFHASHFDALAGGPELREGLLAGVPPSTLMREWADQRARMPIRRSMEYS